MTQRAGRFNLRIEPELLARLQAAADSEGRSIADIIRRACVHYLDGRTETRNRLTRP